jgi:hypothetical protein
LYLVSCIGFSARRLWEVSHKTSAGIYDRVIAVCIAQVNLISSILGSMAIKKVKKCLQSVLKYEFLGVVLSLVGGAIVKQCCSLCTWSLKEAKMERVGGPVPYNRTYVVVEAWMWRRLRHSRATNSIKRRRRQGEIHVDTWKRAKRDVLRQYSIKLIYFLNHCCLSGCSNVYGWVVLA